MILNARPGEGLVVGGPALAFGWPFSSSPFTGGMSVGAGM